MALFAPIPGSSVSLTAPTTSRNVVINSLGTVVQVTNLGPQTAYVAFGASSITGTTADCPILASTIQTFMRSESQRYMSGITTTGSAILLATTGYGPQF